MLLRAISEPWARPSELAHTCARFLLANDAIRGGLARTAEVWSNSSLAVFAENRLLRAVLVFAPICDVALERFATSLRFSLLTAAQFAAERLIAEPLLSFYCAIARQCFINNYVFAQADDEIEQAMALRDTLVASSASGTAFPILSLVVVAAYFPLHALPRIESLVHLEWPNAVKALLAQHLRAGRGKAFTRIHANPDSHLRRCINLGSYAIRREPLSTMGQGGAWTHSEDG